MPYSFTQIEEDKTRTIALVFSFLIGFYFIAFFLIATVVVNVARYNNLPYDRLGSFSPHFLGFTDTLMVLGVALVVGYAHWYITTHNLIKKILGVLGAEKLKDNDSYHQMFRNIIDEVSVATGGTRIEGVVIPTMAMNAFALSDFEGRNVIGITEGVLARLNRAQIEAIVGHEAAHIVSKDCLATTVTSSLFELYSGLLKGCELFLRGSGRSYRSSRSRRDSGGGVIAIILLVYLLLLITKFLSHLVRMFISRQREYRADAIAVRLTRDPLSLAEALYAIGYHWRGQGLTAQELEAIFIINPKYAYLDEHEGGWADLFSTHPPVEKRLQILMDMARTDADTLIGNVERLGKRPRSSVPEAPGSSDQWMVKQAEEWQGPFALVQMATFDWLTPQTWIKRLDNNEVKMAYGDRRLTSMIAGAKGKEGANKGGCPRCHLPLVNVTYEGASVEKCPFCKGVLVEESDVKRLIIRQEVDFSPQVKKIAEGLKDEGEIFGKIKINRDPKSLLSCPHCNHPQAKMMRSFYTEVYRVEIDRCFACGRVWFDADELEVLQCMIEAATARTPEGS